MLPEYRIATVVSGALLLLVAPIVAVRLPRWEGWSLGLLAWTWGWSRILISYAFPVDNLPARLMVYAFLAAPACGAIAGVVFTTRGRIRQGIAASIAGTALALMLWYLIDHDVMIGATIAPINLTFPALLLGLSLAGAGALWRFGITGDRSMLWLATGLFALPAFRSVDIALALLFTPRWDGAIHRAETLLHMVTLAVTALSIGGVGGRPAPMRLWILLTAGVLLGLSMQWVDGLLPTAWARHARYGLDALMASAAALGLMQYAWGARLPDSTATAPLPAQGP